jgi:hypothetical protein
VPESKNERCTQESEEKRQILKTHTHTHTHTRVTLFCERKREG